MFFSKFYHENGNNFDLKLYDWQLNLNEERDRKVLVLPDKIVILVFLFVRRKK